MNLTLGFPEPEAPAARLEAALARFEQWMAAPDSPVRAIHKQAAREGTYAEFPPGLDPRLAAALRARGIGRLYSHQAEAFEHAEAGRNTVVVTPTASGKTLCYNLPVLNAILADGRAKALYLFPTKALAEDQLHEFHELGRALEAAGAPALKAFTYDGDTPQDARRAIRERASVVFTNPDMLHTGILPHHTRWAKLFETLRYIVIDELHYYRGVYGSHMANVIRRLKRICEFYGSRKDGAGPQFVCCSATIANPKELAEAATESPFELVADNGAPSGAKFFVFYNPPVVNAELGIRRSYVGEARRIAVEAIERGQQTLVFANNRLATEVLVKYLKDACEKKTGAETIRGYRGGYLPKERREIERRLRDGQIRGVVATNALELGIDIGGLDTVVMAGYPGTVASTWQRAGRAGRRLTPSLAVLVASSAPLDQYIVDHPEYFFDSTPERAHLNANNLEIVLNHVKCAAFELPIREDETFGPHGVAGMCGFLEETGVLHKTGKQWHWTSDTYPADAISLRAVTSDNFVVIDTTGNNEVIAEVAFPAALTALHEKAIYLHEARQYQVERFDYGQRKAYVRRVESEYYTDAIDYTQVRVLEEFGSESLAKARAVQGDVRVNRQIVGFKKIKFYTNENIGAGNLMMPEQEMHTTAFWLHFPAAFLDDLRDLGPSEKQSGIIGLGQALRTVAAVLLMCDARDLGVAWSEDFSQDQAMYEPNLFLYDAYPGGVGLSAPLFQVRAALLAGARELIAGCGCKAGCPACVGPAGETGEMGKKVALRLLGLLEGSGDQIAACQA
ncbi:MAG: DEAD/DEAH box helicase [Acidobacteria bacterium]|nr:DEAD/DEAH box helicase [Acidobacteriota bacterium]